MVTPKPSSMPKLHTGDVVACWGTDRVSRVISLMTSAILPPWSLCWAPSHVAIIHRQSTPSWPSSRNGKTYFDCRPTGVPVSDTGPFWFESTTLVGNVRGAQAHDPAERWEAYGGRCMVFRPTVVLSQEAKDAMGIELRRMVNHGVPYDMAGAILSGTRFVRYMVPASGQRLFCSELVARALQVAQLMNWESPSSFSPGRLCRTLVKSGAFERV